MENKTKPKEFDVETWDHKLTRCEDDDYSEMYRSNWGGELFVRHEEHLNTIQLVADELINYDLSRLENELCDEGCSDNYINKRKKEKQEILRSLIQSKFTDRIWTDDVKYEE